MTYNDHSDLENVINQLTMKIDIIEFQSFKCGAEMMNKFIPFQQDIKDTVTDIVANKGLRSIHSFLLQFIHQSARQHFKWPE